MTWAALDDIAGVPRTTTRIRAKYLTRTSVNHPDTICRKIDKVGEGDP